MRISASPRSWTSGVRRALATDAPRHPSRTAAKRSSCVGFRVEPVVTHPAPPQTRTCAIHAYGSSVARVSARLWRITVLPCTANQMLWTILGVGST
jgi:hypothetical protein